MSALDLHVSQAGDIPWNLSPEKFASILDRVIDGMPSKKVNILFVGNGICTSFLCLIRMRAEKSNVTVNVTVTDVHEPTLTRQQQQYQDTILISPIPGHCTVAWGILDVANDDHVAEHKERYQIVADKGCLDFFMPGVTKVPGVVKAQPKQVLTNLCHLLNKTEGLAMYVNNTMHLSATVTVLKKYLPMRLLKRTRDDVSFGGHRSQAARTMLCDEMWYSGPHEPITRQITLSSGRKVSNKGYNINSHCFALNIGKPGSSGEPAFAWPAADEGNAWHKWHKIPSKGILTQIGEPEWEGPEV